LKKRDKDVLSLKRALEEKEEFQNLVACLEENDTQRLRAMEEMVGRWEEAGSGGKDEECNCPVGEHEDFLDESTHVFLRSPLALLWRLYLSLSNLEDGPSLFATREGTPVDESASLPPSSTPSRSPSPSEEAYATPVSRTGLCCRGQRATRGRKRATPYPLHLVSRSSSPALGSPNRRGVVLSFWEWGLVIL